MFDDGYFPDPLVEEGKQILLRLCADIEASKPADLAALYILTHAATEAFNELDGKLQDAGSEIETAARDCIGTDFAFIAQAYGFQDADIEELIAPRDW
jgi:hypothetical protein